MEKRKKPRKKDYSETSSAIILCLKKNILLLLVFDCKFFRPSVNESGTISFEQF